MQRNYLTLLTIESRALIDSRCPVPPLLSPFVGFLVAPAASAPRFRSRRPSPPAFR